MTLSGPNSQVHPAHLLALNRKNRHLPYASNRLPSRPLAPKRLHPHLATCRRLSYRDFTFEEVAAAFLYFGSYATVEEANAVALAKRTELHGDWLYETSREKQNLQIGAGGFASGLLLF
jgi:hypothetical protein